MIETVVPDTMLALSTTQLLEDLGYLGVFALMFAETLFPPIPSEAILPLSGYLIERGDLGWPGVLLASTAGAMLGATILYEMARRGGRPFALRFARIARIDEARLDDAERWFARRGAWVVLLGRCVPGVRSLIALPAGTLQMSRGLYLGASLIGTLVWNALLIGIGYLLGAEWDRAADTIGSLSKPLLGIVLVAGGAWVLRLRLRDR
ncbi:DedA family protein [Baekduia sp. Peel2402]|uniref:DedA family protein n=1 Tax=Baekduia sp. Peel2402 TaxID=3458296 RepID=UPI00403EE156